MWSLTPGQFRDRVKDVEIIHNMMQGQGKGRVQRDRRKHREVMLSHGIPLPEDW